MENNRVTSFHILEVLRRYSSKEKPMNVQEISMKMMEEFKLDKTPNRQTIYAHLKELLNLSLAELIGGTVEYIEKNNRIQGYYFKHPLSRGKVKLLCDFIASSRFIPVADSKELIQHLGGPYGSSFVSKFGYLLDLKKETIKSYNDHFFDNVDKLATAIENDKKVSFQYLKYNLDKKFVPRNKEDGGYVTVSPYYLRWTLDHYYLYCRFDKTGDQRFLRVDKIRDVRLLEERIVPHQLPPDVNLRDYTHNQVFMFGGQPERIKLRCETRMIGQVIDFFGDDALIKPLDDTHFELEVRTSIESIKYWVLQYITAIDEIRPAKLKEIVTGFLEDALRRNK